MDRNLTVNEQHELRVLELVEEARQDHPAWCGH